ncbi:hypothetical protein OESDEN_02858 [Oesophagostomum dentatum]|uniref:SXP/RAL-2 family protein Ani s 5-like cation-binding domain-containing protein n=1 Tax=Oesophagostomum dentatum TaxID=61180 RepID=A0A0B1TIW7_OESDE|nr:hypothetical protein OESDEN_02858 [Oesophagostomum dentatum]
MVHPASLKSLPNIVIHHADREEAHTNAPPVSFPSFTFTFPSPLEQVHPVLDSNPSVTPQFPKISIVVLPPVTTPPPVPIDLLVHWIYDLPESSYFGMDEQVVPGNLDPPLPPSPFDKPPFLLEASDDVVAEYYKIVMDEKLTKGELKRALQIWKGSLPPYLQSRYEEAEAERQRISAVEQDLRAQRVTRLSPLARQIADQIEAIRLNDEFTVLEEEHMIRELMQSIPEGVREELTAQ